MREITRSFRCITVKYLVILCDVGMVSTLVSLVTCIDIATEKLAMIHTVVISEAEYSVAESNNSLIYHSLVFYFVPCLFLFLS
jgi:hypothetical protein